jgi:hypothetical protein
MFNFHKACYSDLKPSHWTAALHDLIIKFAPYL